MWLTNPADNTATNRPAMIWVHGGGFKAGIDGVQALNRHREEIRNADTCVSIGYPIDRTSDCQGVQDYTGDPNDPAYLAQGRNASVASPPPSRTPRQPFVRCVVMRRTTRSIRTGSRSEASRRVQSPRRTLPYNSDLAGTWAYSSEDDPHADSQVQAASGASGCNYAPTTIGAGDAPVSFIHSEFDPAVDYDDCVVPSISAARDAGLVAELTSYCGQSGHAQNLYNSHKAATDAQWTTFLARELRSTAACGRRVQIRSAPSGRRPG